MSVDLIYGQPSAPAVDVDHPAGAVAAGDAASQTVGGQLPPVVVVAGGSPGTVEALLSAAAHGDHAALAALKARMAGLVRVNVWRVLHDASRSEAVTEETFAGLLEGAVHFDPHHDNAQSWLLTRAHQHARNGLQPVDDTNDPPAAGPASRHGQPN